MTRVALQPGFVLHRYSYRETSWLLEVFSRDHGRIPVIARGVRNAKSRLRALLQPFTPLLFSWSGKGDLFNLTAAETEGLPFQVPGRRLYSALYLNELLLQLLARSDPYPALFEAYRETLAQLAATTGSEEPSLRIFEKRLLAELGYGLLLDVEANTGLPVDKDKIYRYLPDTGPSSGHTDNAGIAISGQSLLALHGERLEQSEPWSLREIKHLMRAALDLQLNGRPLKTRQSLIAQRLRRTAR